jgi:epoxyqueuosine reductase QueG
MRDLLKKRIIDYVENYKSQHKTKTDWRKPLCAFADAHDPLFLELKKIVGNFHKIPRELLTGANSIITFFIPFTKDVVMSNSTGKVSSKEWAIAYLETNNLIIGLNKHLLDILNEKSEDTVEIPPTHNFNKANLMSYWSHKHVAYISGLGKFGLHRMLITEKGCCGRLGSVITTAEILPSIRKEAEYCLYYFNKSCKKCIDRCSFNALFLESFNRYKCYSVLLENGKRYEDLGLIDTCGKCACDIPCSLENPVNRIDSNAIKRR